MKQASLPREERCRLMFVNDELHDDSEYALYTKFEFLFETGMDLAATKFFLKGLSENAWNLMRHISIYVTRHYPFAVLPNHLLLLVRKDLALWGLLLEDLGLLLPNLRTKKLFIQCSLITRVLHDTPAIDEELLRANLFQDLLSCPSSMGLSYILPRSGCILQADFHNYKTQRQLPNA